MDEKEYSNVYAIPANYTDSGKILGGMLEVRNAVETVLLVALVGYPELMLIPMPGTIRIVVMVLTLIPLAVVSMMGIDGDSLGQYLGHVIRFLFNRRKLHMRRIGYRYDPKQLKKKKKSKKQARKA
ncbi:MAG: PrgI family protein [Oscillospiraceae bacterium]|nr:PrgI family protein [Oscillospiraceae bacterium]